MRRSSSSSRRRRGERQGEEIRKKREGTRSGVGVGELFQYQITISTSVG